MSYQISSSIIDRRVVLPFCRKVSSIQRNWAYRVKREVLGFDPIPSSSQAPRLLVIQFCPKTFLDALWSAWSWLRHGIPDCRPFFVCDGTPPAKASELIQRLFPGAKLAEASSFIEALPEGSEDLTAYFHSHVFARKTAVIHALQADHDVLFSDPDVLALQCPSQILKGIASQIPLFSRNHDSHHYDPWMADRFAQMGHEFDPDFNSGILYIPRGSLSHSLLVEAFAGWQKAPPHRHTGQSYFSGALLAAEASPLDPAHYVASSEGMWFWEKEINYTHIVARHYVGPVRHHLYQVGMPYLLKNR